MSYLGFKKIRDLKPGTVFLVEDDRGKQFVLKQNPVAGRMVKFSQAVHQEGGDLASLLPEFFCQDDWFWQRFLTWELAGDTVESYGIKAEAFSFINPEKLGRAISQLQKLDFNDHGMETRLSDFYLKNIAEFKPALTQEFGAEFANRVEHFLLSQKDLVNKNSHFLANGDLHPQNLMYHGNSFMLIDWDLLHFNNPGWDLTDLYVWGWRDSSWQERLLEEFKKGLTIPLSDFESIFAFDVVYLSSQLIKHARLINAPGEFKEAQKKILIKHLEP